MLEPVVEIRNVLKRYREKEVLSDLTFTVTRGQTFAFLGRNGAGKTTIQMLLGLHKPDAGSIKVLGTDPVVDPLRVRSLVGFMAEGQIMFGWTTVDRLIRFIAPFYLTWDHTLAASYVRQFELPLRTKVRHLSKGQNVRLGLLLALSHRPEVVILDDPALGLDPICGVTSTATWGRICRPKGGPFCTVRICCMRLNLWPTCSRSCMKARSFDRARGRNCGLKFSDW